MKLPATMRGPRVVMLAAALMALVLFGSALLIQDRVRSASEWAARGQGEAFAVAVRDSLRRSRGEPLQPVLEELLSVHAESGLRYVALYDERGAPIAEAGHAVGSSLDERGLERLGERVRYVARPPRRRGPGPLRPADLLLGGGRRMGQVVFEFEPLEASALQREARTLLAVASVAGLGILALAWAFARGLAQQERMRDELERGQRLAALGTMSAVLAHELRNPLAALKGHAQLLAEEVEGQPALSPRVERLVTDAVRLERLMNDLLTFVQSGALQRAPVDPNLPLREAVASTGTAGIRLQLLDAPPVVALDAGRLQQALENVLRNAVEVTPEGAQVEAAVTVEEGRLIYRVRDRGPGLPPGEEERIFEPFATHKITGVGLGLAIARRITELHGGTVAARTLEGGGAEFRLELPMEET